ncbi:MAG: YHS domain-containing (seleno)protein [Bacteroidota bacterium]
MRKALGLLILLLSITVVGQNKNYNTKKGFVANGYDVVAYFDGQATKGDDSYMVEHDGVNFKFMNGNNLEKFKANPEKYIPKYGGYCAYAVAVSGKKVSVNPETFEIREGELYLFYNSGKNNTLQLWLDESPDVLKQQADKNWEKIKK